jgi:hypothetical protein
MDLLILLKTITKLNEQISELETILFNLHEIHKFRSDRVCCEEFFEQYQQYKEKYKND